MSESFNMEAAMVFARYRDYPRLLQYVFAKVQFTKLVKQNAIMHSLELRAKG